MYFQARLVNFAHKILPRAHWQGHKTGLASRIDYIVKYYFFLLWAAAFFPAVFFVKGNSFDVRQSDQLEARWVDSVFAQMTDAERIGQLMMVRAHSDKDSAYEQAVEDQIRQYKVGGLCFFQGTPERQAALTNRYQAAARIPLMISMDAEWGLGMRMKEHTVAFPRQLMLGAVRDNRLIYEMGREIARQCRRLGVHVNFAPVADVNNNPDNPVINERSFGEDRFNVAAKCFQYVQGLQDGGVMACAKHFPGHGDTNVDSHFDLPLIPHSAKRLDSLELFPFRVLAQYDVGAMMVGHLNVPALDARPNRPTTLSRPAVYDLLRQEIGYDGLVFTDGMEMQGVAKYFSPGEADVEALRAGNDVVLLPGDVGAAVNAIQQALQDGRLDRQAVYESTRRILRAKYRLGLTAPQRVDTVNIRNEINNPEAFLLKRRLIAGALTLVRDRQNLIGFPDLAQRRFATLAIGDTNRTIFQTYCGYYAPMAHFNAGMNLDSTAARALEDSLARYDLVLVSLHNMSSKAAVNFGLSPESIALLQRINQRVTVALTVLGNPYSLRYFDEIPLVLQAYTNDPMAQELAAQALFGAIDLQGKLPVTASSEARFGQGVQKLYTDYRLGYDLPEAQGMSGKTLRKIDTLAAELIAAGAAPGCQILVARKGKIVWHKAYGRFTYDTAAPPVTTESIYDLASITKVAATTLEVMQLTETGQLDIRRPAADYIPELRSTNKKDLSLESMLVHQAGLQAWIPFYQNTVEKRQPLPQWYSALPGGEFRIPVAEGLYMQRSYADSIWAQIFRSELRPDKSYKYSDLGLYLTERALRNAAGTGLDVYMHDKFYRPLGLSTTVFNPWKYGLTARCAPTEEDAYFRQRRVQGYVHDMGAAMLGGVSGHAGLFSNANDLAKIFQMLLQKGRYFGKNYLHPATVNRFTTRYPGSSRRGIGFDMKELNSEATQNMSPLASDKTFGHTGFTGNAVWADPEEQLIFIFLSNRTFPTMENNKLIDGNYRPRIQEIVYRAIQRPGGSVR